MPLINRRVMKPKRARMGKRKTVRKLKRAVPVAVQRYVKTAISRRQEDKHASPYVLNSLAITPYDSSIAPSTIINLTTVLSQITQGAGQGQRIGNVISVKSLNFKGHVNMIQGGTTPDNLPCFIKMFIGRKQVDLSSPTDQSKLFTSGNSAGPPGNLPQDIYRWVNKDLFRIYATRVFKLGVATSSGGSFANNDFQTTRFFNINLNKHIGNVKYNDTDAFPTNCAYYAWFVMCAFDGSTISLGGSAYPKTEIHCDVSVKYEDA